MDVVDELVVGVDIGYGDGGEHFLQGHFEGAIELFLVKLLAALFYRVHAVFSEQVRVNPQRQFDLRVRQINEISSRNVEISVFFGQFFCLID